MTRRKLRKQRTFRRRAFDWLQSPRGVAAILGILGLVILVAGHLYYYAAWWPRWLYLAAGWEQTFEALWANVGTTLVGVTLVVYTVEWVGERRAMEQLKAQLIREMGNTADAGVTHRAVSELRAHGWLWDGSLQGANLIEANLRGADLRAADLRGTTLWRADLSGAYLTSANLQGANLRGADLRETYLIGTNLGGARLYETDLRGAFLSRAFLRRADLRGANLEGTFEANLDGAIIDERTKLPIPKAEGPAQDALPVQDPTRLDDHPPQVEPPGVGLPPR